MQKAYERPWRYYGSNYQLIDLDGDVLPEILTEQACQWTYKRNLGVNNQVLMDGKKVTFLRFQEILGLKEKPVVGLNTDKA